jgi:hypothetical protein
MVAGTTGQINVIISHKHRDRGRVLQRRIDVVSIAKSLYATRPWQSYTWICHCDVITKKGDKRRMVLTQSGLASNGSNWERP